MTMVPVDIKIRMFTCSKTHPDGKWYPPYETSVTDKKGRKRKSKQKGAYIRFESSLEADTKTDPEVFKGLKGFVTLTTPELIEDVNKFHKGVPNIRSVVDKDGKVIPLDRKCLGKIVVKRKPRPDDGAIVCQIVLR